MGFRRGNAIWPMRSARATGWSPRPQISVRRWRAADDWLARLGVCPGESWGPLVAAFRSARSMRQSINDFSSLYSTVVALG